MSKRFRNKRKIDDASASTVDMNAQHPQSIWTDNNILMLLITVAFVTSVGSALASQNSAWWSSWLQNFSTEIMGALFTFILFEHILGNRRRTEDRERQASLRAEDRARQTRIRREDRERDEALRNEAEKQRLIIQLGSKINTTANTAAEQLRARGWHRDGCLENISLWEADLSGCMLIGAVLVGSDMRANFAGATLQFSDLTKCLLYEADLKAARLHEVDFTEADLRHANLENADCRKVNFTSADLRRANLKGTDLRGANLRGAMLRDAEFDQWTILPDAVVIADDGFDEEYDKLWTPDTDMSRYTNPKHPDFWRAGD